MNQQLTTKQYFTTLTIIHAALMAGQFFFALFIVMIHYKDGRVFVPGSVDDDMTFKIIAMVMTAACILGSNALFKMQLSGVKNNAGRKSKLTGYQSLLIVKYALMEGASLFSLCMFFITADYLFLGLSSIVIVFFLINRPTRNGVINDLELNSRESQLLNEPNAVITDETEL